MRRWTLAKRFGPALALFERVISRSSLESFNWPSAALPGISQTNDPENLTASAADSFQAIFTQSITPDSAETQSSNFLSQPSWGNNALSAESTTNLNSGSIVDESEAAPAQRAASSNLGLNSFKTTARTVLQRNVIPKQERSSEGSSPANARAHTIVDADSKDNQTAASPLTDDSAYSSLNATSNPAAATPGSSANGKRFSGLIGFQQNALSVAAINALGGAKSLSGAAFAVRITPAANQVSTASNATQNGAAADTNAGSANSAPDLLGSAANPSPSGARAQTMPESASGSGTAPMPLAAIAPPSAPAMSFAPAAPAESVTTTTEADEIAAEDPSGAPQPVRTVQIQLAGEGERRVDLRLVEHGGGLSVSVRASDSALTRGLQQNLPDLSARLAAEKYQTHTFLPAASEASSDSNSSSGQSSGQAEQQNPGRSFSQGGSQSGGRQPQSGQQDQALAWWRQLAALGKLSSSASTSTPVSAAIGRVVQQ